AEIFSPSTHGISCATAQSAQMKHVPWRRGLPGLSRLRRSIPTGRVMSRRLRDISIAVYPILFVCMGARNGGFCMARKSISDVLQHDHNHDGIDRRGFLKCMAWAGTGAFCVIQGGVLKSYSLSRLSEITPRAAAGELSFVQISDSHMGFNK